jgi:hypothetical protein
MNTDNTSISKIGQKDRNSCFHRPFVLTAHTGDDLHWVYSLDDNPPLQPICREYEIHALKYNGQALSNQRDMRQSLIMTEDQHRAAITSNNANGELIATVSDGNRKANNNFVGWWHGCLFYPQNEPIFDKTYTCAVFHLDGGVSFEEICFTEELHLSRVCRMQDSFVEDITDCVDFVISGQPLVRHGRPVQLEEIATQFHDWRHLVTPIRIVLPSGEELYFPSTQMQRGLKRKALDAAVHIALEAQVDENTLIPLSQKGWLKMRKRDAAAIDRAEAFLRAHQLLGATETMSEDSTLFCVAQQLETLMLQAIAISLHELVEHSGMLREGQCRFINDHLEIRFRTAIYPHHVFVRLAGGATGSVQFPGLSGRSGTTLPDAINYLTNELAVRDAILLDNGGDVRMWYRGKYIVEPSQPRPEIRALLGLVSFNGGGKPGAVTVW